MEANTGILDRATSLVRQHFEKNVPSSLYFHDLHHTIQVVDASRQMAAAMQLTEEDRLALLLAAWFHDTGYGVQYEGHEVASVEIARRFCREQNLAESLTEKVASCILATRMPQSPASLIEQIICDADMAHLGSGHYPEESKLLRKEINTVFNKDISKKAWRRTNIRFLEEHRYFTEYARTHFEPVKQAHLKTLLEKEAASKGETVETPVGKIEDVPASEAIPTEKEKKPADKVSQSRTDRGIATMFRIMSENHVSLSQMADSKANIMISVNTIVLSILVSVLLGKLQYYPQFILPTAILALVCLTAVIFAIRATRPTVTGGVFTEEDIRQKKANLLFFGNFFKMDLKEYEWGMKEMMNDSEYLYDSMIKDIYFLGRVLARKYHFLRISYNVFMYGLIIAVLSFAIASFIGMK
ncbi:MAG: HD domain-containing protein [Flavipsychrobacter sp.]|jgi:predicted metal-dependent HD superfamily phosphohydrolase|nr:HD domain-containing protein [Flavipsychrobacter sp.]